MDRRPSHTTAHQLAKGVAPVVASPQEAPCREEDAQNYQAREPGLVLASPIVARPCPSSLRKTETLTRSTCWEVM